MPVAIALSEKALVWIAVPTLSHGVCRKLPPSASCGANAIACRNPSSRPHRDPISAETASMWAGSFASISSTSTGSGSRRADFSVSPIARPNDVRTISAPCSCRACAAAYAIDSRVSTPVTSSFLPSSSIGIPSVAPHAIARDVDLKAVAKVDLHRHLEGAVRLVDDARPVPGGPVTRCRRRRRPSSPSARRCCSRWVRSRRSCRGSPSRRARSSTRPRRSGSRSRRSRTWPPTTSGWPSSASRPSSCASRTGWTGTPRWPRSSAASSAAAASST